MRTPPAGLISSSSIEQARDLNVSARRANAQPASPSALQVGSRRDRPSRALQTATENQVSGSKRKRKVIDPVAKRILAGLGFNPKQIASMFNGGGKAVIEFLRQDGNLRMLTHNAQGELLFSQDQIVQMASKGGAGPALKHLCSEDHLCRLAATFLPMQIFRMVKHRNLRPALRVLCDKEKLGKLGKTFSPEQIVSMAGINGAAEVLNLLCEEGTLDKLINPKTFSREQVVKMACNIGANLTLRLLLTADNLSNLQKMFPENLELIVKIASNDSASQALAFLLDESKLGMLEPMFSHETIAKMACNKGAKNALELLCDPDMLGRLEGFSHEKIAKIASRKGARKTLEFLSDANKLSKLCELRAFSAEQIVSMASNNSASPVLEFLANTAELSKLGTFSDENIVHMASRHSASLTLQFLSGKDNLAKLTRLGFSADKIAVIAGYASSSLTLAAVINEPWVKCLKKSELFELIHRNSGSVSLLWFMQHWPALEAKGVKKDRAIAVATNSNDAVKANFLKEHDESAGVTFSELAINWLEREQALRPSSSAGGVAGAPAQPGVSAQAMPASDTGSSALADQLLADDDSDADPYPLTRSPGTAPTWIN